MQIEFKTNFPDNIKVHECEARLEGDEIIFTCPLCPAYEQRINLKTEERNLKSDNNPTIYHKGNFIPVELAVEGGGVN